MTNRVRASGSSSRVHTLAATAERWDDVVTAFGRRGNDPDWCWCQRLIDSPSDDAARTTNRDALHLEVLSAEVSPGILAYIADQPVGWTRVMKRTTVPGVLRNRALRRILNDEPGAWWVVCFAVDQRHRNSGVATALLGAAVDHARANGATCLEGHPVDTHALQADHVSGSALFTGTMRTFLAQGFSEIGRSFPSRPVMRLDF